MSVSLACAMMHVMDCAVVCAVAVVATTAAVTVAVVAGRPWL